MDQGTSNDVDAAEMVKKILAKIGPEEALRRLTLRTPGLNQFRSDRIEVITSEQGITADELIYLRMLLSWIASAQEIGKTIPVVTWAEYHALAELTVKQL